MTRGKGSKRNTAPEYSDSWGESPRIKHHGPGKDPSPVPDSQAAHFLGFPLTASGSCFEHLHQHHLYVPSTMQVAGAGRHSSAPNKALTLPARASWGRQMECLIPKCSERLHNLFRDTQPCSSICQVLTHVCLLALRAAQPALPCPRAQAPHTPPPPPTLTQPHGPCSLLLPNEPRSCPCGQ